MKKIIFVMLALLFTTSAYGSTNTPKQFQTNWNILNSGEQRVIDNPAHALLKVVVSVNNNSDSIMLMCNNTPLQIFPGNAAVCVSNSVNMPISWFDNNFYLGASGSYSVE